MISLLLEFGADVNGRNSGGKTAVMFAASHGHTDAVRILLAEGAEIDAVDKEELCAMTHGVSAGSLAVIGLLTQAEWPTPMTLNKERITLQEAAQQSATLAAFLGKLMLLASNENLHNSYSLTFAGHGEILEFLLDMTEVKVNDCDTLKGETPLCAASSAGRKRCVEILLRRGGRPDVSNLKVRKQYTKSGME